MTFHDYLDVFRNRRIGAMLLLGFASGLPLALTSGTLQAWMTVEGLDIRTIGLFSLVGQAYIFKFLWAPLMDRFTPPGFSSSLGRRRGWLVLTQAGLVASIAAMAFTPPHAALWALAGLAVLVAFLSASQDIVFDAYSTDVLHTSERGVGAAVKVLGYRLAMLVSGGLALYLADRVMGWSNMYLVMAGLMALGIFTTLWSPEPEVSARPPRSLQEAVVGPLKDFFSRRGAWALLALIVLYKLGDAFALSLSTTFLIRAVGFSAGEVGIVNKTLGLAATIIGALYGGMLMVRLGLVRSLLLFGVLQGVSNFAYWALSVSPKHLWSMALAVGIENLCGGMGTAAFVALLMALCNRSFSATQYALLSALASIGRVYVGPTAGYLVQAYGWPTFYLMSVVLAAPGLVVLWFMRGTIGRYESEQNERALEAKAAKAASA
nr:muropeptide transporter [uncultured Ralstonia sp.]